MSEQGLPLPQQEREEIAGEIEILPWGYELERFGFEDVDSRVDGIGEHLRPARFLKETLDASALVGDHHTVLQRIVYLGEQDGGDGALFLVKLQSRGEVEVSEQVAGDHDEGLVEVLFEVLHSAGGAGQFLLHLELDRKPLGRAIAEVRFNLVGQVVQVRVDIAHPMRLEQKEYVLHDGPVSYGDHGLGPRGGNRPKAGSFTRP